MSTCLCVFIPIKKFLFSVNAYAFQNGSTWGWVRFFA